MCMERTGSNFHYQSSQIFLIILHGRVYPIYTQKLVNNRDQWAELGLAIKYLYHDQHVSVQNDDTDDDERSIG